MQGRFQRQVRRTIGNPQCRPATFCAGTSRVLFAKRDRGWSEQPCPGQFETLQEEQFCIRVLLGCTRAHGQPSGRHRRIRLVR